MEAKAGQGRIDAADGAALPGAARPALTLRVPRRGVLASRGRVPWSCWGSSGTTVRYVGRNASLLQPPGPPEAVIEARQFDCAVCGQASFVSEQADLGAYVQCPFCLTTSTSDPSSSKCRAGCWLVAGIFCLALIVALITAQVYGIHNHVYVNIFPLFTATMCLRRAWMLWKLPRSTLHSERVLYQPSIAECTAVNLKTGKPMVRVAVPPQQHHTNVPA